MAEKWQAGAPTAPREKKKPKKQKPLPGGLGRLK